jgi:poly(A) polymerase
MIKKFIDKLLGKKSAGGKPAPFRQARRSRPAVHGIDPALVDDRAANVVQHPQAGRLRGLHRRRRGARPAGGPAPKDFDVATNATPEQVKGLFRRAFIIGRRFRIVHVVYGRGREHEVIEVSTFRAYLDNAAAEQVAATKDQQGELAGMKHAVDSTGRVLRDNVWGPQDEDATRRDFTINAMYYDPETQIVVDYHGGIKDAKKTAAHDWRPGHALPRRPGAHHPRRAVCRQAQRRWASRSTQDRRAAGPSRNLLADVPQSRCSTKCSSCCRPATRWPPSSSSRRWAWRAASTRCWTWWWSAPTSRL